MSFFIDVAFQLNDGCRDRTVTALFLQALQAGKNTAGEDLLLLLDLTDILVLLFLLEKPFVNGKDHAEDHIE